MQIRLIVDQASLHQLYHLLEFMFLRRCFSTALFLGRVSNHLQTQKSSSKETKGKNSRNWKWKYWHRKTENERRGKNTWQIWQEILLLKNWFFFFRFFFSKLKLNFLLFFIIFISFYFCRIILFFQFHCDYKKVE